MMLHLVLMTSLVLASLPPEAARHNERGLQHYRQGEFEAAVGALALAYAAMPDARHHLADRDGVLAAMRSILLTLYEKTGEARHLCRTRELLVGHLEALLLAFGEDTTLEDVPGTQWRLGQVEDALRKHVLPCSKPKARSLSRPPPAHPVVLPRPRDPRETRRPWTVAGGVSLGLGGAFLGAMAYALLTLRASFVAVRQLEALARDRGEATPTEVTSVATLGEVAERHRSVALGTGISGGLLAVAGLTVLLVGQRRARRLALRPSLGSLRLDLSF